MKDEACQAISKGENCPNYPRREVGGALLCRDHLNILKDGQTLVLRNGEKLRIQ